MQSFEPGYTCCMTSKENHFNVSAFWHTESFQSIFSSHYMCPSFSNYKVSSQLTGYCTRCSFNVLRGHNNYNHANFTSNGISSDRLSLKLYHKVLPQLRSSLYNYFNYFQKSTFIDSECTISDLPSSVFLPGIFGPVGLTQLLQSVVY